MWLLGNEGKAWDGRLWPRLPVPAPRKCYIFILYILKDVVLRYLSFCFFSLVGAGGRREDRRETLPPRAEQQEQRLVEQRDSNHEKVSVNIYKVKPMDNV